MVSCVVDKFHIFTFDIKKNLIITKNFLMFS